MLSRDTCELIPSEVNALGITSLQVHIQAPIVDFLYEITYIKGR